MSGHLHAVCLPTANCFDVCRWRPSPAGLLLLIHPYFMEGSRMRRRKTELSTGVDEEQQDMRLPSASEWLGFLTTGGSALPTYRENWLCSLFCVIVISRKRSPLEFFLLSPFQQPAIQGCALHSLLSLPNIVPRYHYSPDCVVSYWYGKRNAKLCSVVAFRDVQSSPFLH